MKFRFSILLILLNPSFLLAQTEMSEAEKILIKSQGIRMKEQWDYKYTGDKLSGNGFISSRTSFDKYGRIIEVVNYKSDTTVLNVTAYAYNEKGLRTEYIKYNGNRKTIVFKQAILYDSKGNKISETGINGGDDFKNLYAYDASGKLAQIRYFSENKLMEVRTFVYKGNRTEVQISDGNNNSISTLLTIKDDLGHILEESKFDEQQKIIEQMIYAYDNKGNILSEEKHSKGKLVSKTIYVYDSSGRLLEIYSEEENTPKFLKQNYSYGSNGFLLGEFWKNIPSSEQSFRKYTYDTKGRLISTDCYFATYKYKVFNKYVYQTY